MTCPDAMPATGAVGSAASVRAGGLHGHLERAGWEAGAHAGSGRNVSRHRHQCRPERARQWRRLVPSRALSELYRAMACIFVDLLVVLLLQSVHLSGLI